MRPFIFLLRCRSSKSPAELIRFIGSVVILPLWSRLKSSWANQPKLTKATNQSINQSNQQQRRTTNADERRHWYRAQPKPRTRPLTIFCRALFSPQEGLYHNDDSYTTTATTATTTATTTANTPTTTAAVLWARRLEGAKTSSARHRRSGLPQLKAPLPARRRTTHKSTGPRSPARLSSTASTTTTTILPARVVFE